jgi:hypothetical protein
MTNRWIIIFVGRVEHGATHRILVGCTTLHPAYGEELIRAIRYQ